MLIQAGAAGFGLTLPALLQKPAAAARAKSCIWIFLSGGASQYETWDPKPDAPSEYRGTFRPIATNVNGVQITEHMPLLARQAHRYSIIRSMSHAEAGHPAGSYWMITGRRYPRAPARASAMSREDHPHHGSVMSLVRPSESRGIPSFVTLPEQMNPVGPVRAGQHAGFLGSAYDPMVLNADLENPRFTASEFRLIDGVNEGRLARRRALLAQQNLASRLEEESGAGYGTAPYVERAFDLLAGGEAAGAFDLERETTATREQYGSHLFGQSMLVGRRLVEAGVRLVAVNWVRHDDGPGGQGWDTHSNHLSWSRDELLPHTDRAIAALLADLDDRGMLDETLVVVTGEFGRTPRFNVNGGRDHWPHVFSLLIAGGGIRSGIVHGASTPDGAHVASDGVTPGDLAATMYHLLGVSHETEIRDRQNRPYTLAEGAPIKGLL